MCHFIRRHNHWNRIGQSVQSYASIIKKSIFNIVSQLRGVCKENVSRHLRSGCFESNLNVPINLSMEKMCYQYEVKFYIEKIFPADHPIFICSNIYTQNFHVIHEPYSYKRETNQGSALLIFI